MAIIKCPECRKPISDKSTICSHCGYATKGASDEEIERANRIIRLKKKNKLLMIVFASMIVFIAGTLFFYFGRQSNNEIYKLLGYGGMIFGGAGYIFSRVQTFMLKRR